MPESEDSARILQVILGGMNPQQQAADQQYNTPLDPAAEEQFQAWAAQRSASEGRDVLRDLADYDLRGFWKNAGMAAENGHLPDTYKKPNHPTFSTESMYSGGPNPTGGTWGENTFTPSANILQAPHALEELLRYFAENEPGVKLLQPSAPAPAGGIGLAQQEPAGLGMAR